MWAEADFIGPLSASVGPFSMNVVPSDPSFSMIVVPKRGCFWARAFMFSGRYNYAASNLRINAVCPGIIATAMMQRFTGGTPEGEQRVIAQEPVGRMGKPEEIAAAVVWLCSEAAAFVIGHVMVVDGGQTVQ